MQKIKRFFGCLIPVMTCNMKCSYCYVIQRDNRKNRMAELKYSPYQIGLALTMKRLGGGCYFSICGAGETTLQPEIDDIVYRILEQGHFINIMTNGTVTVQLMLSNFVGAADGVLRKSYRAYKRLRKK